MSTREVNQEKARLDHKSGAHRDGRRQSDQALFFSEARYRALYRDNPTMIFTLDADFKIISANPHAASQTGFTIDELEGRKPERLRHRAGNGGADRPASWWQGVG